MDHRALRLALITSFVLHAAALGAVALRPTAPVPPVRAAELPESWGGDTFEVDEVLGRGASKSEPAPKGAPPPEAPAPETPPPPPKSAPPPATQSEPSPEPAPKSEPAPKPVPKPTPPRAPKPAVSGQQSNPSAKPAEQAALPASAAEGSGDGGARYGAEGLPPGVRRLAKAFTRAVTAATNRDPFWDEQALGNVGSARLEIELDADGRISAANTGKDELAPPLRRLVERTLLLLRTGRFALSVPGLSAGKEVFRIEVTLGRGVATEDYDNPRDTVSLGFDPPSQSAPGRAYFLHASGLRFEAKVTLESSTASGG